MTFAREIYLVDSKLGFCVDSEDCISAYGRQISALHTALQRPSISNVNITEHLHSSIGAFQAFWSIASYVIYSKPLSLDRVSIVGSGMLHY